MNVVPETANGPMMLTPEHLTTDSCAGRLSVPVPVNGPVLSGLGIIAVRLWSMSAVNAEWQRVEGINCLQFAKAP